MADRAVPSYLIKRILKIDEHAPRVNKKSVAALALALEYAKDVHRHIVNSGLSYPVRPEHIVSVAFDPRFIKYEFLTHARKILEAQGDDMPPINKIMAAARDAGDKEHSGGAAEGNVEEESGNKMQKSDDGTPNAKSDKEAGGNITSADSTLKRTAKSGPKSGPKRLKQSILSYFTPK